jgi:hypothetical protein
MKKTKCMSKPELSQVGVRSMGGNSVVKSMGGYVDVER